MSEGEQLKKRRDLTFELVEFLENLSEKDRLPLAINAIGVSEAYFKNLEITEHFWKFVMRKN